VLALVAPAAEAQQQPPRKGAQAAVPKAPAPEPTPYGVWIDHTGRGAVEITECGANLCGRIVWLKDAANKKGCGIQIIGNAKPMGKGRWDGGWIYDPEKRAKYDVELKPIGTDKLRVLGYMGTKLFSETMIWKRPTTELERCDKAEPASTTPPAPARKADEAAPAPKGKAPPAAKGKAKPQTSAPAECKQYVAQIGRMVTVPCEKKKKKDR